jgi:hypothetical protein
VTHSDHKLKSLYKYGIRSALRKIRNLGIDGKYTELIDILKETNDFQGDFLKAEDLNRIREGVYKSFCLIPEKGRLNKVIDYLIHFCVENLQVEEQIFLFPYLSAMIAQSLDSDEIMQMLQNSTTEGRFLVFNSILSLEMVARGYLVKNIFPSLNELASYLCLDLDLSLFLENLQDIEYNLPLMSYEFGDNKITNIPKIDNSVINEKIKVGNFSLIEDKDREKCFSRYFRLTHLDKISFLKCKSLVEMNFVSLWESLEHELAEEKDAITFYQINQVELFQSFYYLAAYSPKDDKGWHSGLGRVFAWESIHEFISDEEFINPYQTNFLLKEFTFATFVSDSEWFSGNRGNHGFMVKNSTNTEIRILSISLN